MKKRQFGYNGWANYETWLVSVWDLVEAMSEEVGSWDVSELQNCDAQWCEDWVYDVSEESSIRDGIFNDLVSNFFGTVDWREIADAVREGAEGYR